MSDATTIVPEKTSRAIFFRIKRGINCALIFIVPIVRVIFIVFSRFERVSRCKTFRDLINRKHLTTSQWTAASRGNDIRRRLKDFFVAAFLRPKTYCPMPTEHTMCARRGNFFFVAPRDRRDKGLRCRGPNIKLLATPPHGRFFTPERRLSRCFSIFPRARIICYLFAPRGDIYIYI